MTSDVELAEVTESLACSNYEIVELKAREERVSLEQRTDPEIQASRLHLDQGTLRWVSMGSISGE